jgi:hypothetical protein
MARCNVTVFDATEIHIGLFVGLPTHRSAWEALIDAPSCLDVPFLRDVP